MPALREIQEDIPLIFNYYLQHYRDKYGMPGADSGAGVLRYLVSHAWPGNIRELKNFAERVALGFPFADGGTGSEPQEPLTLNRMLERTEREALVTAMRLTNGHVADAADILGVPAKTLYDKLARFSIAATGFKT